MTGYFGVTKDEPQRTDGPRFSSGVSAGRLLSPFPVEVPKKLKREATVVSGFGRRLLPKWKLHFLLNPLLSFVVSSSFSIRPLKERVGQPGRALWTQCPRGLWLCGLQGSPAVHGVEGSGGLGGSLPNPRTGLGPAPVRAELGALHSATRRSLCRRQFWGHTPPHCSLSGNRDDWREIPWRGLPCPALPTPLPWETRGGGRAGLSKFL